MEKIYEVAIVGGGPGGIGTAVEAAVHGIENILLLDKADNHSSTIRRFYKKNKRVDRNWKGQVVEIEGSIPFMDGTKETTLDFFDQLLDEDKIDTAFNTEVEEITKDETTNTFTIQTSTKVFIAKCVVVTIGKMGKPNKPEYKIPFSLKEYINFNLDKCSKNEKILVVGGGNSAVEYACSLSEEENTVTLVYRKEKFTRLNPENHETLFKYDGQEKLRLRLNTDIESIENDDGRVKINFNDGYHTIYDRVIYAIGGTAPVDFLKKAGIKMDEEGKPIYDEYNETNVSCMYVAGDVAFNTGGSIATALNHGFRITKSLLKKRGEDSSTTDQFFKNNPTFKY